MAETVEQKSSKPNCEDWRWLQLAILVQTASHSDQIAWTIFGHFWAVNALLLVALFSTGAFPDLWVTVTVCAAGFAIASLWWLIQRRAIGHLHFREKVVHVLEKDLEIPAKYALSGRINSDLYEKCVKKHRIRVRKSMKCFILCALTLWLIGLVWSLVLLFCRSGICEAGT